MAGNREDIQERRTLGCRCCSRCSSGRWRSKWAEEEGNMEDILRRRIRGCTHCSGCFSGIWLSMWEVEGSMVGIQEHRTLGCKHYFECFCDKWPSIPQQVVPGCLMRSRVRDQIRGSPHSTISSPPASSPSSGWSATWCTPPWARQCSSRGPSRQGRAWSRACTASAAPTCTAPRASRRESSAPRFGILGDQRELRTLEKWNGKHVSCFT